MQPYYEDEQARLYLGDDLDILNNNTVPDGSIDLIFTSPPYNLGGVESGFATPGSDNKTGKWSGGKLAGGYESHDDNMPHSEYVKWQKHCLLSMWQKLSPHGAIYYNHKPRLRNREVWLPLELNPSLPLRQIIIWARPGGVNFSPTHFVPTHEWIMVFAKPDYQLKSRGASGIGDVWSVTPEQSPHPAPFPLGLPLRAIDASANIETVADFYLGSGTTARAARDSGKYFIGGDNNEGYLKMAIERLSQLALPL